jgi:hypothetical protein
VLLLSPGYLQPLGPDKTALRLLHVVVLYNLDQGYRKRPPPSPLHSRNPARSGFVQEASFRNPEACFWISEARSGVQKCAPCQSGSVAPRSELSKSRSTLLEHFNHASRRAYTLPRLREKNTHFFLIFELS